VFLSYIFWAKLLDFNLMMLNVIASFFIYSVFQSVWNCNSILTDMYNCELYFFLFTFAVSIGFLRLIYLYVCVVCVCVCVCLGAILPDFK